MLVLIIGENSLIKPKSLDRSIFATFSYISSIYAREIAAATPIDHEVIVPEKYGDIDFQNKYDIVHIHFKTATANRAYQIADKLRENGNVVVLSGAHPSALPDEAKAHAGSIMIGNVEFLWPRVLNDYIDGDLKPFYKTDKNFSKEEFELPNIKPSPSVSIIGVVEATRGCPYKCDFCQESNTLHGSNFRTRDVADVINEIKALPQKFIFFCDVSLTIDVDYTKELFKQMKPLRKKFVCEGNADVLSEDDELIKLSAEAGCIEWTVGLESFNQQVIESVHKKTNIIKNYRKIVKNMHRHKISILGNFIFGFDFDTVDVFDFTLESIKKIGLDSARFAILTPYPGTPLFEKLEKDNRILTRDWSMYNRKNVVFEPENMKIEELQKGYEKVMNEYNHISNSFIRCVKGLSLGYNPFLATLGRNLESYMNKPKK